MFSGLIEDFVIPWVKNAFIFKTLLNRRSWKVASQLHINLPTVD